MIRNSVITADLHCTNWKPFGLPLSDGINSRMKNCLNVLEEIFQYATKNKILKVFILGDIFHVRGRIETTVYDSVYSFIKNKARLGFEIYIVVGKGKG